MILEISTLKFVQLQKFEKKQQCLNLGPKCLVGPFWPRTPNLGIFALDVKKNLLPYLKSGTSNFSICKFCKKTKMPKFGNKYACFGCFLVGTWKQYCHIWSQYPQISPLVKFREETKNCKNTLSGYFWWKIKKNYCHIRNEHPQICQIWKIRWKSTIPKFGTKNALLGIFDQEYLIYVFLG